MRALFPGAGTKLEGPTKFISGLKYVPEWKALLTCDGDEAFELKYVPEWEADTANNYLEEYDICRQCQRGRAALAASRLKLKKKTERR